MKNAKPLLLALLAVIIFGLNACSKTTADQTSPAAKVESGPKKALNAFYEAMRSKNETGITGALSKTSIAKMNYVNREMKQNGFNYYIYKLAFEREGLIGQSTDPNDLIELDVVGEKIEPDKATLDLKNPKDGQTSQAKFVLEDGAWKLDILSR